MALDRGEILIWAFATLAAFGLAVGIAFAFSAGSDRVAPEPTLVGSRTAGSGGGSAAGLPSSTERALPLPSPGLPPPTDVIRVPKQELPEPTDVLELPPPRLPEPLGPIQPEPQRSNR